MTRPFLPPRREPGHARGIEDVDEGESLVLSDLINRVLDKGVVISSHITISIADIDLVELDLKLLISSVATLAERAAERGKRGNVSVRSDPHA